MHGQFLPHIIWFEPLAADHFALLLKWLETPHVKAWWDPGIQWTLEQIQEKYGPYVYGYKHGKDGKKPLYAYIIYIGGNPIGYIQLYDAYDFPRDEGYLPDNLPQSLGALDFFIGESAFLGKGYGSLILKRFLEDYVKSKFEACFVDPDAKNQKAIRAYEKAGFRPIHHPSQGSSIWMINILKEAGSKPIPYNIIPA